MKKQENHTEDEKNIMQEPDAGYEKAETDLLLEGIKRSFEERFLMMTRLMKIGSMLKNAKIIKTPSLNS
ncbi:MAG: hypothetical protein HYX40_11785 [Sphingobacteriales bacterium]|nr:hypothetical protein [Sphingobacteriales bacterium]